MKMIQRHMQSVTFVVIAGILLMFAFYISQQTRSGNQRSRSRVTPHAADRSLQEMPDCEGLTRTEEKLTCYAEAAQVSDGLVLFLVDELIQMESESSRQLELIETQIAWEDARNAECVFISGATDDDEDAALQELICLTEQNLARLARLEYYLNDLFCLEDCEVETEAGN